MTRLESCEAQYQLQWRPIPGNGSGINEIYFSLPKSFRYVKDGRLCMF